GSSVVGYRIRFDLRCCGWRLLRWSLTNWCRRRRRRRSHGMARVRRCVGVWFLRRHQRKQAEFNQAHQHPHLVGLIGLATRISAVSSGSSRIRPVSDIETASMLRAANTPNETGPPPRTAVRTLRMAMRATCLALGLPVLVLASGGSWSLAVMLASTVLLTLLVERSELRREASDALEIV